MKIAVIEDDFPIADMYKHKLRAAKHEVKVAYNGEEGLELLKTFQPDLALVDIKMPKLKGDEMLEEVRSCDWGADLRVIILTNISRDEAPSKLRFLNIDRYIVKAHHTPSQVLAVVNEVLGVKA
ncbi:MAG: response regulator [Candidatus Saccharibacteria bacterium]|nr:response regulator [Candidatus Saccharibacteria bacterium]